MIETHDHRSSSVRKFFSATAVSILLALPGFAFSQALFNPYVSAQFEHDSNVFRIPSSTQAIQFYGGPRLADTDLRYIAGLDGTYLWGLQKLTAEIEGRRIDYQHFNFLDHYEYLGKAELDWKVASLLDGIVSVKQEHLAAYFADRQSPTLEVDTERNIVGKLNLHFRTDWRLETGVNSRTYISPLQFFPDFTEHQTGTHLGVSYLGVANLAYGISADHISGNFTHAIGVGPYTQTTGDLKMTYLITGLTTLNAELGYTRRDQSANEDSLGAITGQFSYKRQLTGKTSVTAQIQRQVFSYTASAGSEIDSTASVAADWQATYKLDVAAKLAYTRMTYVGQAIPGSTDNGRVDHSPYESLTVTYLALRNLQLKAYLTAQRRNSNIYLDTYRDSTVGIQAQAHWR